MTSIDGIYWTPRSQGVNNNYWQSVCWSPQLKIFLAVGSKNVMTSTNGISWTSTSQGVLPIVCWTVCWSPELGIFVALGEYRAMTSTNGITWIEISQSLDINAYWRGVCWSPELGIFVGVASVDTDNQKHLVMTSSFKVRPPTTYTLFDSSFNAIDESGNWTFSKIITPSANIIDLSVNNINGQDCTNLIYKITMIMAHYDII